MFRYWLLSVLLGACGSVDDTTSSSESARDDFGATVVAKLADIPGCTPAEEGALVYVQELKSFKTCQLESWADIDLKGEPGAAGAKGDAGQKGDKGDAGEVGPVGDSGVSIVSITNLNSTGTDLCTRYSNYSCLVATGSVKRYSNGLTEFQAKYYHFYSFDDGGDFDSDSYWVTTSLVTAGPGDAWVRTSIDLIARTGSDDKKWLWLVYTATSDSFALVFDVNDNATYDIDTDEVIEVLTETSVYEE